MQFKSYTRVSRSTYTHKIQLSRIPPIEPIASESVVQDVKTTKMIWNRRSILKKPNSRKGSGTLYKDINEPCFGNGHHYLLSGEGDIELENEWMWILSQILTVQSCAFIAFIIYPPSLVDGCLKADKTTFLWGCAHRPKSMDLYAGWCKGVVLICHDILPRSAFVH